MLRIALAVMVMLGCAVPASAQVDADGRRPRQPRRPAGDTSSVVATPRPSLGVDDGGIHQRDPIIAPSVAPDVSSSARSSVLSHVETGDRDIALTLDDGYQPDPRVLDLIESYGVRGTAFIVGEVADANPELLRRLVELDWMVCSHSYTHRELTNLSSGVIASEIRRGVLAVERVVGYRCPYFRAPFGSVDSRVVAEARALGLKIIGWDASLSDSAPVGTHPGLQIEVAQRDITPGTILLGHFGANNSYEVLSALLAWLDEVGYAVGSVSDLISGDVRPLHRPIKVYVEPATPAEPMSRLRSFVAAPGAQAAPVVICVGVTLVLVTRRRRSRGKQRPSEWVHTAPLSKDRVSVRD